MNRRKRGWTTGRGALWAMNGLGGWATYPIIKPMTSTTYIIFLSWNYEIIISL